MKDALTRLRLGLVPSMLICAQPGAERRVVEGMMKKDDHYLLHYGGADKYVGVAAAGLH